MQPTDSRLLRGGTINDEINSNIDKDYNRFGKKEILEDQQFTLITVLVDEAKFEPVLSTIPDM